MQQRLQIINNDYNNNNRFNNNNNNFNDEIITNSNDWKGNFEYNKLQDALIKSLFSKNPLRLLPSLIYFFLLIWCTKQYLSRLCLYYEFLTSHGSYSFACGELLPSFMILNCVTMNDEKFKETDTYLLFNELFDAFCVFYTNFQWSESSDQWMIFFFYFFTLLYKTSHHLQKQCHLFQN